MVKVALFVRLEAKPGKEKEDESFLVSGLHDQDCICPCDQLSRNWAVRVMASPGRSCLDARPVREHLLCGRAAQTVLATDKENVVRQSVTCGLTPELSRTAARPRQSHNPTGLCRGRAAVSA